MGGEVQYAARLPPQLESVLTVAVVVLVDALVLVAPPPPEDGEDAVTELLHVDVDPGATDGRARYVTHDLAQMLCDIPHSRILMVGCLEVLMTIVLPTIIF